jgi:EmrB/QacA subfamily drug resistance transporter
MTTLRRNPWAILAVLSLAYFMAQLDVSVLTLAIPSIRHDMHAPLNEIVWALSAYIFVLAVMLITSGRLGDLFGRRRMFLSGVALFTLFSLAGGFAHSPGELIAARALQGMGAALLTPQTLALVVESFPAERRGTAMGVRGAVGGLAALAGPVLGGILVSSLGWRWVFFINVPVGIVTLALGWVSLPSAPRAQERPRLDLGGVGLVSAGLFCFTFAVSEGENFHWSAWIWVLLAAAAVLLGGFVLQQRGRQSTSPLVPFELFKDRNYGLMNVFSVAISLTVIGLVLVLSVYLQSVLGFSALKAGLVIVPASFFSMVLDPVAGKLSDRLQGKYLLLLGAVLTGAGMLWTAAQMHTGAGWAVFVAPMCVIGIGNAFLFTPLAVVALYGVRPEMAGSASGVLVTALQAGSMIGTAAVGAVLQGGSSISLDADTTRDAMFWLVGMTALAAIACVAARPNIVRGAGSQDAPGAPDEATPAVAHD